jgi:medium-chain acyl-[acyl-carrier-protein] hydrolase
MASELISDTMTRSAWFTAFAPRRAARLRMFCFPYVGGAAAVFRPWGRHFNDHVEVLALQLPGRERRLSDPLVDTIAGLVDAIAPTFEDLDTPFVFFGHSMGGLVAFELMRELRRRKGPMPSLLLASACSAPQIPDYVDPPRSTQSEDEIVHELRRLNGTDEAILEHEELRRLLLPALRADFNIVDLYRYYDEPPLDCPIIALGGMHDSGITVDMLAGWQLQTTRGFDLQMFNGDHFYLHACRDALLATLAREITRVIR